MSPGPVRRHFIEWSNSRRFVLWFLAFWVVACGVAILISYTDAVALRDRGLRTQAVVREVHGGRDSYVTLEFTSRVGQTITADVGAYYWSPKPQVGDRPTIIYDPKDPSGLVADARLGPDFFATWLFCAGGALAAGLFALTYTGRINWLAIAEDRYRPD